MGVTLEVWRQHIGAFGGGVRTSRRSAGSVSGFHFAFPRSVAFVLFVLLSLIVVAADVETNPGPGPSSYQCPSCLDVSSTLCANASHQKIHKMDKNYLFKCAGPLCPFQFTTYQGLINHISSIHEISVPLVPSSSESSPKCPLFSECDEQIATEKDLAYHALEHLRNGSNLHCPFKNLCESEVLYEGGENGCSKLRRHFSQYHRSWRTSDVAREVPSTSAPSALIEDPVVSMDINASGAEDTPAGTGPLVALGSIQDDWKNIDNVFDFIAKFYLGLEAQYFLPASTVQVLSEKLKLLSEVLYDRTENVLTRELQKCNLTDVQVKTVLNNVALNDVLYLSHHKDAPGPTLTSDHLRMEYFKTYFQYCKPNQLQINIDPLHPKYVHHISIKDTLEFLFKDPNVVHLIERSFLRESANLDTEDEDFVYSDYYHGRVCKSRSLFGEERIDLIIMQDGFNVANPLGSAKKKYPLTAVYFTVGNFPPFIRSKLDAIFMTLLAHEAYVKKKATQAKCFEPVVNELRKLHQEGVEFNGRKIKVVVQFIAGDNLGSHQIGGYLESFSKVIYFCRFCEVTRKEFLDNPLSKGIPRTPGRYSYCLEKLRVMQRTKPSVLSFRGIKHDSTFNQLPDFHVADPGLPVCAAHDLFEGVVNYDLANIIFNLVASDWITYDILKKRIDDFKYVGTDSGNKPSTGISEKGTSLKGHAVQNWTLLRLLPLILEGNIKDTHNQYWQLYLKLKKMVELIMASRFSERTIDAVDNSVKIYLEERCKILGDGKPKHHYLLHYAWLIRLFGPIINLWTLRFESKHAFLKRIARACRNFKNLGFTLSNRHQLYLSYLWTGSCFQLGVTEVKQLRSPIALHTGPFKLFMKQEGLNPSESLQSVTLSGITYKQGNLILIRKCAAGLMCGRIKFIYLDGNAVKFVFQGVLAFENEDLGLYKMVEEEYNYFCLPQSDLDYPVPHAYYYYEEDEVFSLKSNVL